MFATDHGSAKPSHTYSQMGPAHLSRAWIGNLQPNDLKTGSSSGHLSGSHGCYCDCGCHKFSYFFFVRVDGVVTIAHSIKSVSVYRCVTDGQTTMRPRRCQRALWLQRSDKSGGPEIGESGENQSLNDGKNHCGRNTKHECTIGCFQRP